MLNITYTAKNMGFTITILLQFQQTTIVFAFCILLAYVIHFCLVKSLKSHFACEKQLLKTQKTNMNGDAISIVGSFLTFPEMIRCSIVSKTWLHFIWPSFLSGNQLQLYSTYFSNIDAGLQIILKYCHRAQNLNLSMCHMLTSARLLQICNTITGLQALDISRCVFLRANGLTDLCKLKNLQELRMQGLSMLKIMPLLPSSITCLDVAHCGNLHDIATVCTLPELKYVNISGCELLPFEQILLLVQSCKTCKVIQLRNVYHISAAQMKQLQQENVACTIKKK